MKFRIFVSVLLLVGFLQSAISEDYVQADVYKGLRGTALALDEESVQSRNGILAVLMETGYDVAAVTVLAAGDGSASLYFTNGGGLIGAGEHEEVRAVVFETLSEAEAHLSQLEPTEVFPLPGEGRTRFYVVTSDGVLTAEADEVALGEQKHELSPLFHQVHKLIAYIRMADEFRQSQGSE